MSRRRLRVGNAPVSWGIFEEAMSGADRWPAERVLDDMARAGYEGTELGPYGYLPVDPKALSAMLAPRNLRLASSFVPVRLADPAAAEAGAEEVLRVGALLATQGVQEVIIADAMDDGRAQIAGRVGAGVGWSDAEWKRATSALDQIARRLDEALRMRVVVHHHAGTFLETPAEIDRLLTSTDPDHVGLLLDTGHYLYGGGDPVDCVRRYGGRIRYVHLKDVDAECLATVRNEGLDLKRAWARGVFCELGRGAVDFPTVVEGLRAVGYAGWLIVEQDVVPAADGTLDPDPFSSAQNSRRYLKERIGV